MLQTTTYKELPTFFGVDYTKNSVATKNRINYSTGGAILPGRSYNAGTYRYGAFGHEMDNEVKGIGNHLSFNDYGLDVRLCRRWRIDPHSSNYPSMSGYSAFANNPIINLDPDGKDIVYFNTQGLESHRVKSNTEFKTFIMGSPKAGDPKISVVGWKEVAMPKIIQERTQQPGVATTSPNYQEHDYVISARTGYFNQAKNSGELNLYTEGGNAIPKDAVQAIPDLDPTLVKAIAMQESTLGVNGATDLMTANNPDDWAANYKMKEPYGLSKDTKLSETNSLYYGIRILATKGFKFGSDGKGNFKFGGWDHATKYFNYPGTKGYENYVKTMEDNAKTPDCSNYSDECK